MKKLNHQEMNMLIREEVLALASRKIFEEGKADIKKARDRMIREGYSKKRIDEFSISALTGMGQRLAGLGLSDFVDVGESEGLFGGMSKGIRVAIEQSILEAIVTKMGLDPYSGFGLTLKNAFEQVLKKYTAGELQQLMTSDSGCQTTAFNIAREVLQIIEESEKERVLSMAMQAVLGELGRDFQTSKITKNIYQNIRERFSEAFDDIFDEDYFAKEIAEMICDHFTLDNILSTAKNTIGSSASSAFGELSSAFDELKKEYID